MEYHHVQKAQVVNDTLFSSGQQNILPQIKKNISFNRNTK
jgi:hypothetical protein